MRILRELSRRKLRTSLTITGITIGIWALVVFSSLANQINGLSGGGTITNSSTGTPTRSPHPSPRTR